MPHSLIRRIAAFSVLALLSLTPRQSQAQVLKGQILGTVTDQSGAVVPAPDVSDNEPAGSGAQREF